MHVAWAIPCIISTVLLAGAEGHPPGLIFVPLVVAIWVLGHIVLVAVRVIAERFGADHCYTGIWPVSVIVATAGTGATSIFGVVAIAWPFLGGADIGTEHLPSIVGVWLFHVVAFFGLLSRKGWARILSALLASAWGLVVSLQIADHLSHGRPVQPLELVLALGIVAAAAALAVALLWGSRARSYARFEASQ